MNNINEYSLTASEKAKLAEIDNKLSQAARIIGSEPGIYFEFNIRPDEDSGSDDEFMARRLELYLNKTGTKA